MSEDIFQLGVKALIIDRHTNRLLLLRVNVATFTRQASAYWDIPGGRVHRGATVTTTLEREIKEETGIGELINLQPLTTVVSNIRIPYQDTDTGLILQIYTAVVTGQPEVNLSAEHTDYEWVDREEAAVRLQVKYPTDFIEYVKNIMPV